MMHIQKQNRRDFIKAASISAASTLFLHDEIPLRSMNEEIRIFVWDERHPDQKEAYKNFLGNEIADYLRQERGLIVKSVGINDANHGISDAVLNNSDVIIWWGHERQSEISSVIGRKIVERISAGDLALIALHSAHWSTPFIEAMNEITRRRAVLEHPDAKLITYSQPPTQYTTPDYNTRITPYTRKRKFPNGKETIEVHLPYCCFPAYRDDGKPSIVKVLQPSHPITQGIPTEFELPHTEMYDEPFHVPEPDEVILEERWATGEWFRSGILWRLGKGIVFYFRPGHETFPIYKNEMALRVIRNATQWAGKKPYTL